MISSLTSSNDATDPSFFSVTRMIRYPPSVGMGSETPPSGSANATASTAAFISPRCRTPEVAAGGAAGRGGVLAGQRREVLAGAGAGHQGPGLLLVGHHDLVQVDAGAGGCSAALLRSYSARASASLTVGLGLQLAGEDLAAHDRALDVALQVVERHPLAAQLALQLGVVGDVVLLLDAVDDLLDVLRAQADPELGRRAAG